MQRLKSDLVSCHEVDNVVVVRFRQERMDDADKIYEVRSTLLEFLAPRSRVHLLLDMSRVEYLRSEGLALFVSLVKKASQSGGVVKICSLQPSIAELFRLTCFDRIFEIFPGEEEALASFSEAGRPLEDSEGEDP